MKTKTFISVIWAILSLAFALACSRPAPEPDPQPAECRKVLVLYSAGYNNLTSYLKSDIKDLCSNAPTLSLSRYYKVLVFSHLKKGVYDNTPVSPVLMEVVTGPDGKPALDTLVRYEPSVSSASAQTVENVLKYVKANFPAQEYGMIMSSHANGWVPAGYFISPWDEKDDDLFNLARTVPGPVSLPYFAEDPEVKALCFQDDKSSPTGGMEMDLSDFVDAISNSGIHLRYLALDMCLMGGVEVAYELKDVVDYLAFSPTEVLSDGFAYETILHRLLYASQADIVGVCRDYFAQYEKSRRSATVTAVDCSKLGDLRDVCLDLFKKYAVQIAQLDQDTVQPYCTARRYFFDLRHALETAGITSQERSKLDAALMECVLYHNETEYFSASGEYFKLGNCCGFSMYLPSGERPKLNESYKELAWNKATSLVK